MQNQTEAGFPAFFINIAMGLSGANVDAAVTSIVNQCIRSGRIAIGWGYWSQEDIDTGDDATLDSKQKSWYSGEFGASTNYDVPAQRTAIRNAIERLSKMPIGTSIIAYFPGHGIFGHGTVIGEYLGDDPNALYIGKTGGRNFYRTRRVEWGVVAPIIDSKPVTVNVAWGGINRPTNGQKAFVHNETVKALPPNVYEHLMKLLVSKYR